MVWGLAVESAGSGFQVQDSGFHGQGPFRTRLRLRALWLGVMGLVGTLSVCEVARYCQEGPDAAYD